MKTKNKGRIVAKILTFSVVAAIVFSVNVLHVKADEPAFPVNFGTGTLDVNARNRVDMDNYGGGSENYYASGEFSVAALPNNMTLDSLFSQYKCINFKAKIIEDNNECKVSEIVYSFDVEIPVEGSEPERASVRFVQGYPTEVQLTAGQSVTFSLDMQTCKEYNSIELNVPEGSNLSYDAIKGYEIVGIACDFKLSSKGTVSYVDPDATGFTIDTSKPYLNIVIPEMEVRGEFKSWGGWNNIKALYNVDENKGTGFITYENLLTNYKGIKIKVNVSNIDTRFNKDDEIFFYLHDPEDKMSTVKNGVKYDITDAHSVSKQYVHKNGGIQEFTFDFAGTYYMKGDAAPDIWLSMGVESNAGDGEEDDDVHYCSIKPVIENSNGTVSLGEGCEKMQFADSGNTVNDGLMDVEKAAKISLNVSDEAGALNAIGSNDTPSDAKQAQLKALVDANSKIGTDASAKERIKQVMEINLTIDATEVQPKNNSVKVTIPDSKFNITDTNKLKIYHHTGGNLVEITGVVAENGMISFDTPSFSYFVVVEGSGSSGGSNGGGSSSQSSSSSTNSGQSSSKSVMINTSNAGGVTRNLESSMLINDINKAAPGTVLAIDRKYNRQLLSNAEMKALLNKKTVSLRMQYNYNGVEYDVIIPAGTAKNDGIPYYGPIYLAVYYPNASSVIGGLTLQTVGNNANAGGITGKYIVQSGDTFSGIAKKHGMTVSSLKLKNPQIKNIDRISIGQVIYL